MSTKRKAEQQLDKDDIKKIKSDVETILSTLTKIEQKLETKNSSSSVNVVEFGNKFTDESCSILMRNGSHILVSAHEDPEDCPWDRSQDGVKLAKPDVITDHLEIKCRGVRTADRIAADNKEFDDVEEDELEIDFNEDNIIHLQIQNTGKQVDAFVCNLLNEADILDKDIDWGDWDDMVRAHVKGVLYVTVTMLATPFETHPIEGLVEYQRKLLGVDLTPTIASYIS
jgi:hypothetical protein